MNWAEDFRSALRALRARPGFVAAAATTLALGIGITTAVFSVVDALMLRPLPYRDATRVVNLGAREKGGPANAGYTLQGWKELQQRTEIFERLEGYILRNTVMTGGSEPLSVTLLQTTPGAFLMLGVVPQLGRWLVDGDMNGASGPVVVLSHRLWREQFGGNPNIVGQKVEFDDVPYMIVGVMPPDFVFPRVGIRAWVPLPAPPPATAATRLHQLVGRLREGVAFDQASQMVSATGGRLREIKGINAGRDPALDRIENTAPQDRQPIWIMFGAVILVLAIACANVANLGLANGARRARELAVCVAIGAPRVRLVRQLLFESLLVGAIGGLAGAWLAYAAVETLAPRIPSGLAFFNANRIQVDERVLLFAMSITTLTAMAAGLLPALRGSRHDGFEVLRSSGRSITASTLERRMLSGIAIAQCAVAVLLLVGAGLLIKSFLRLQAVDPGFDPRQLAVLKFTPPRQRYPDAAAQQVLREQIASALTAVPGVRGATIAGGVPPQGGGFYFDVDLEINDAPGPVANDLYIAFTPVEPNYFSVLGIALRAGRVFNEGDTATSVVINEVFAERYWGSPAAAIGRRFRVDDDEPWREVVGVAADVKQLGLDDRFGPLEFYYSWPRTGAGSGQHAVAVRVTGDPASIIPTLKQRIWSLDSRLSMSDAQDIRLLFAQSVERPRFFLTLMTVFALVAAAIAGLGIYGLFSYLVTQRLREMGIRVALGASTQQVAGLVLREGAVLAAIGVVVGLAGVWAMSRVLTNLLFQTTPTDPATLVGGTLTLLALALAACAVPARRAKRVDPLALLKIE